MALSKIKSSSMADTAIHGRRNIVINGAMQVAQRGTSSTGITSGTSNFVVDRFPLRVGSQGTWTMSQATDAPDGFSNSLKLDCTTSDATTSASDQIRLTHKFEGQDLQQFKFGSSSASNMTLSFWVKSNKTGTYTLEFFNNDASRTISVAYTISSASTWEKKTITIDGDTSGSFDNDNNNSLEIIWWLAAGSDFNGGTFNTSWAANVNANRVSSSQVNLADSTSNEWYITGIQLEVGSQATPFEHRSYGEELALCQRYYEKHQGAGGSADRGISSFAVGAGIWYSTAQVLAHFPYNTVKRATPSISVSSAGALKAYSSGTAKTANDDTCFDQLGVRNARFNISPFVGSGTAGQGTLMQLNSSESIEIDAEL